MDKEFNPTPLDALTALAEAEVAAQIYGEKSHLAQEKYDTARAYTVIAAEKAVGNDIDYQSALGVLRDTPLETEFRHTYFSAANELADYRYEFPNLFPTPENMKPSYSQPVKSVETAIDVNGRPLDTSTKKHADIAPAVQNNPYPEAKNAEIEKSGKYDPIRLDALSTFAEAEAAAQLHGEKSDIAQDKYDTARAYAVTAAERAVKTDIEIGMLDCDSGMGVLQDTPLEAVFRAAYTEAVKQQANYRYEFPTVFPSPDGMKANPSSYSEAVKSIATTIAPAIQKSNPYQQGKAAAIEKSRPLDMKQEPAVKKTSSMRMR